MTDWIIAIGGVSVLLALVGIAHLIETRTSRIMTTLTNVETSETDLISKTDALLAHAVAQDALIAQLQAALANGGMDPTTAQALQGVADAMAAESAKVAAFLTPVTAPTA